MGAEERRRAALLGRTQADPLGSRPGDGRALRGDRAAGRQTHRDRRAVQHRGGPGSEGDRPDLHRRGSRYRAERWPHRHRRGRQDQPPQGLGRRRLPLRRARPDGGSRRARQGRRHFHRRIPEGLNIMADISSNFLGIKSPNPFWLASAPPTDKEINVTRAFEAGWGGVVWKTLGEDPPVVNVSGPRYSTLMSQDRRVIGLNNIELITDRPLRTNLEEIKRVNPMYSALI
eukprot:Opistho-2@43778